MTVGTMTRGHEAPLGRRLDAGVAGRRLGESSSVGPMSPSESDRGRLSPDRPARRAALRVAEGSGSSSPPSVTSSSTSPVNAAARGSGRRGCGAARTAQDAAVGDGSRGPRPSDSSIQSPPVAARSAARPSRRRPDSSPLGAGASVAAALRPPEFTRAGRAAVRWRVGERRASRSPRTRRRERGRAPGRSAPRRARRR